MNRAQDTDGLALLALTVFLCLYLVLPAWMAARRGRSPLGWILMTLLLSPLVTVIALLVLGPTARQTFADMARRER